MRRTRLAGRVISGMAVVSVLGGCMLGPDDPPETRSLPPAFAEASAGARAAGANSGPLPEAAFWRDLGDPVLSGILERAFSSSPDIARATDRIRESRALSGVAWAALLPELHAGASYSRLRYSTESPLFSEFGVNNFPAFNPNANDWKGSLTMAYELDLWGKNRRAHQASLFDLSGEIEKRRSIGLTLAGDVCTAYIDYRTLEARRRISVELETSLGALEKIASDRFQGGLGSDLDVARAQAERGNARASISDFDRQLALAEHRLAVLAGLPPGSLRETLRGTPSALVAFQVPAGVPAQLISQRPDLRELSERLRAATARVGQAKADLFPQIVLQGEIGSEAVSVSKLATRGAVYWSAGPSLNIPLFDWGRRADQWTAAEERVEEALHDLEKQLLVALQEVEDALASTREDARRRQALRAAAEASRRSVKIAEDKYSVGLLSQLEVIDAERTRLQAQDNLEDAEGRVIRDAVVLSKSLGGGFRAAERQMPPLDPVKDR